MSFLFLGDDRDTSGDDLNLAWDSANAALDPDSSTVLTLRASKVLAEALTVTLDATLPSGATLSAQTITIPADSDEGSVTLLGSSELVAGSGSVTLEAGAGYSIGSPSTVAIMTSGASSGGGGDETANIMVAAQGGTGGDQPPRMLHFLAAVVPPVPVSQLPNLSLDGKRVQAVQMARENTDLIDSVHVYGFDDGAEHMPDDASPLVLRAAQAGDEVPTQAGIFTTAPQLSFELEVEGINEALVCSTADYLHDERFTDAASSAKFKQSGPEIVRERSYLARPHRFDAFGSQATMPSGDAVGGVDWCVTSIAGDADVFLVEGRLLNSIYDSSEDTHQTNSKADGTFHVKRFTAKAPDGWVIDPGEHPSPTMGAAPSQDYALVKARATSYLMRPKTRYGFWFIMRRVSAGAPAQERGRGYLSSKNIGWAVGDLGPTRQPVYGDFAQSTIDYERAGFTLQDGQPGLTGWDAIRWLGRNIAGLESSFEGYGAQWAGGGAHPETAYKQRLGMWHMAGGSNMGPTGFSGRHPVGALVPHWGWWDRTRYMLEYGAQRMIRSHRDIQDGSAAWWWRSLRKGGADDGKVGSVNSLGYNAIRTGLWTFNEPRRTEDNTQWHDSDAAGWCAAPQDRPHNSPLILDGTLTLASSTDNSMTLNEAVPPSTPQEGTILVTSDKGGVYGFKYTSWSGSTFSGMSLPYLPGEDFVEDASVKTTMADPDWQAIDEVQPLAMTHLGYMRIPLQDGWYCCRRYNAYRDYEELSAACSRAAIPHNNVSADPAGGHSFTSLTQCYGGILEVGKDAEYGAANWGQTGEFVASSFYEITPSTPSWAIRSMRPAPIRGYARQLQWLSGFSAIADQEQRDNLLGRTNSEAFAASGAATEEEANTVGRAWDVVDYLTTPAGVCGSRSSAGQPNPFSVGTSTSSFIAPDLPARIGATPSAQSGHPDPTPGKELTFHQGYLVAALGGVLARSISPASPRYNALDRSFEMLEDYITGREAVGLTADGFDNWPYYLWTRYDDYPSSISNGGTFSGGEGASRAPAKVSRASVRAGDLAWAYRRAGGGSDGTEAAEPYDYYGQLHRWKVAGVGLAAARKLGDDAYISRYVGKVFGLGDTVTAQQLIDQFVRYSVGGDDTLESQFTRDTGSANNLTYLLADTSMTISVPMLAHLLNTVS